MTEVQATCECPIYPFGPERPHFVPFFPFYGLLVLAKCTTKRTNFVTDRHFVPNRNMVNRVCRDCPITGCGAKYLVKLSNHLADVHLLDCEERRKYLQQARLQPKIKVITYQDNKSATPKSNVTTSAQEAKCVIFYQKSIPRNRDQSRKRREKKRSKNIKRIIE